jgi:hypothetical protein
VDDWTSGLASFVACLHENRKAWDWTGVWVLGGWGRGSFWSLVRKITKYRSICTHGSDACDWLRIKIAGWNRYRGMWE